jgi:hypothetical protein
MNDINLSVKKCKADDKYDVKIKQSIKNHINEEIGSSTSGKVVNHLKNELLKLHIHGISTGYYGITNTEMTKASLLRCDNLIKSIVRHIESGATNKQVIEKYGESNVEIKVLAHNNHRKSYGSYSVEPRHFVITELNENLWDYLFRRIQESIIEVGAAVGKELDCSYYLIEVDKKNFHTKVLPRSINSALRMLYLDKYKGLIKKSLELKKRGFSSWDAFFLGHIVPSNCETYDNYNGFISGRSWYYQTPKMLKSRMMVNSTSTNAAFTKDDGVTNIDYSIVDKLLIEDDYEELLSYLKKMSFGDDPNIGKHALYNGIESNIMTNGSHYEIIGSNEDSFLITDNFFNQRHIKKTKFTINEQH